jgi:predicted PurR-regulated permease PerM
LAEVADDNSPLEGPLAEAPSLPERDGVIPLPRELVPTLLAGILVVLILFALYFAGALMVPLILAFTLNFVLQPAMRVMIRFHIPKVIAASVILALFFGAVVAAGSSLAGPVADWVARAPASLTRLEDRLRTINKPLEQLQRTTAEVDKITGNPATSGTSVTLRGPGLRGFIFSGTRSMVTGFLTMLVLLFFLLISGDMFLRRLVEILPSLSNKKQAVEISREIERNVSAYLITVSIMNLGVGVLTGLAMYFCELSDPVMWGALAFVLNFLLLLGPLVGVGILGLVGLSTFDSIGHALLPAALYLAIHLLESQVVTPLLLARRFTFNPVAVILSLLFWYWMWGVAGALLAVPLLATVKITCDRVRPLMAFGHFLGAEPRA